MLDTVTMTKQTAVLLSLLIAGGCRICADCEDAAYPAYGGAWQRTIRDSGRVGSIFDPAGGKAFDLSDRDQPDDVVEQERQRYRDRNDRGEDPGEDPGDDLPLDADGIDLPSDREHDIRDRKLDDIENPREDQQREKSLDEIDVNVIQGDPAPPLF